MKWIVIPFYSTPPALRHRGHAFFLGTDKNVVQAASTEEDWGTVKTPLSLWQRHRHHTFITGIKAQKPHLLYWDLGTEATPTFFRTEPQRPGLVHWYHATETMSASLGLTDITEAFTIKTEAQKPLTGIEAQRQCLLHLGSRHIVTNLCHWDW